MSAVNTPALTYDITSSITNVVGDDFIANFTPVFSNFSSDSSIQIVHDPLTSMLNRIPNGTGISGGFEKSIVPAVTDNMIDDNFVFELFQNITRAKYNVAKIIY